MRAGCAHDNCRAFWMPIRQSRLLMRLATPHISSTGWFASRVAVRFGLPGVSANTLRNCGHTLLAHCADLGRIFVGSLPTPTVRPVVASTCVRMRRPKCSKPSQKSMPVRSRNISSMEYCSTRGVISSSAVFTRETYRGLCRIENLQKLLTL